MVLALPPVSARPKCLQRGCSFSNSVILVVDLSLPFCWAHIVSVGEERWLVVCASCWALGSAHELSLTVASAQHLSYNEVLSLCLTLLCVCVYTRDQYYTLTLTERIFLCSFPYSGKPNTAQLENREERKLVRG